MKSGNLASPSCTLYTSLNPLYIGNAVVRVSDASANRWTALQEAHAFVPVLFISDVAPSHPHDSMLLSSTLLILIRAWSSAPLYPYLPRAIRHRLAMTSGDRQNQLAGASASHAPAPLSLDAP